MTNKELIVKTIDYLKLKFGHVNVIDTIWKDLKLDLSKQSELREILLTHELINLGADQWTMKLTAAGILLKPDQLDDSGKLKIESEIRLRKEVISYQKDEFSALEKEHLKLQITHLKRKIPYAIIGFIVGLIPFFWNVYTSKKQNLPSEIHLHVENGLINTDTTMLLKIDSTNLNTANKK